MRATALPLICDADTGFGEALNVERTVQLFEEAGAAGIHLEDQIMPKRCGHLSGKSLIESAAMEAKIRAACAGRKDESILHHRTHRCTRRQWHDDAVDRANRYRAAGADAIFPEALETEAEFAQFATESPGLMLANMTEFGKSPLLDADDAGQTGLPHDSVPGDFIANRPESR